MKLLTMFLLLHTVVITLAAPAGSNTAQRASIAESSVIMTQGAYPDSSSMGSSHDLLESRCAGSEPATNQGSVTSIITTAPTGTLVTAPTANNELSNTCTFNMDEASLKVYMVGIILAASFAGIALTIVSMIACSVGIYVKRYTQFNVHNCRQCGNAAKLAYVSW
jgi:hypothetical protein